MADRLNLASEKTTIVWNAIRDIADRCVNGSITLNFKRGELQGLEKRESLNFAEEKAETKEVKK